MTWPVALSAGAVLVSVACLIWSVKRSGTAQADNGDSKSAVPATASAGYVELNFVDANGATTNIVRQPFSVVPTPGPAPGPGPTPSAPIPESGFRVLIVTAKADISDLPAAQVSALTSKQLGDYLNSHCAVGQDGQTREWRAWTEKMDVRTASQLWQRAYARPRSSSPWILVSNGTSGFEGPLPADTSSLLTLLKRYGGD